MESAERLILFPPWSYCIVQCLSDTLRYPVLLFEINKITCVLFSFFCHQFILLWIKYKQRAKNGNFLIVKSKNIALQPSHQWNIVQIWSDEVLGAATPARYKDISDQCPYIRGAVAHTHIYIFIYQAQYSKSEQEIFYPWSHRYCSTVLNAVILLC